MIESERLLLRWFTEDDVEPSYQMNLDPEVTRYTLDGGVHSRQEIHDLIHNNVFADYRKYGFGRFAVIHKSDNQFIGFAGLKRLEEGEVDLGYRLRREYWGQGIATEASRMSLEYGFGTLELLRIIAMAYAENAASINVMKKLGFHFEKQIQEDGCPVHCYALPKADFFTMGLQLPGDV